MFRRKRSQSTPPPDRSTSIAATAAASIAARGTDRTSTGLSSAAAAAALRHVSAAKTPAAPVVATRGGTHSRQSSADSTSSATRAVKSRMSSRSLRSPSPTPAEALPMLYSPTDRDPSSPTPPARPMALPVEIARPVRGRTHSALASVREEDSDGEEVYVDYGEDEPVPRPSTVGGPRPPSRASFHEANAAASYAQSGAQTRRFVPVQAVAGRQPGAAAAPRARGGASEEAIILAQAMFHAQKNLAKSKQSKQSKGTAGTASEAQQPAPYRKSKGRQPPPTAANQGPSSEAIELAKQMLLENPNGVLRTKKEKKKKKKKAQEDGVEYDEEEPKPEEPDHFKDHLLRNFGKFREDGDEDSAAKSRKRRPSFTLASLNSYRSWSSGNSRRNSNSTDRDRQPFSHTDVPRLPSLSSRHDSLVGEATGVPDITAEQSDRLARRPRQIDIGRFMFEQRHDLDPILDVPGSSDSKDEGTTMDVEEQGKVSTEDAPGSADSAHVQQERWEAVRARWSDLKSQQFRGGLDANEAQTDYEIASPILAEDDDDDKDGADADADQKTITAPTPPATLKDLTADDSSSVYSQHLTLDTPINIPNPEDRREPTPPPKKPALQTKTLRPKKHAKFSTDLAKPRTPDPDLEALTIQVSQAPPLQRTGSDSSFRRRRRPSSAAAAPGGRYSMSLSMRSAGPPRADEGVPSRPASRARMGMGSAMGSSTPLPRREYSPDSFEGVGKARTLAKKGSFMRMLGRFSKSGHA